MLKLTLVSLLLFVLAGCVVTPVQAVIEAGKKLGGYKR